MDEVWLHEPGSTARTRLNCTYGARLNGRKCNARTRFHILRLSTNRKKKFDTTVFRGCASKETCRHKRFYGILRLCFQKKCWNEWIYGLSRLRRVWLWSDGSCLCFFCFKWFVRELIFLECFLFSFLLEVSKNVGAKKKKENRNYRRIILESVDGGIASTAA